VIGIIPASGLALRFRGIPKFLLPAPGQSRSLVESHVIEMLAVCERVLLGVRPEYSKHLDLGNDDRVELLELETKTMTETVVKLCAQSNSDEFLLTMPDTFFIGEKPTTQLLDPDDSDLHLAIWEYEDSFRGRVGQVSIDGSGNVLDAIDKSPDCAYPWFWGAMRFNSKVLPFLDPDTPHVGYAIRSSLAAGLQVKARQIKGKYFDCGSFEHYDAAYRAYALGEV